MPCLEFRVELHEPIDEPLVLFFEVGAGVGPCLLGVLHQFRFKHPLHCRPPPTPCPPAPPNPLPAPARTVGSSPGASSARTGPTSPPATPASETLIWCTRGCVIAMLGAHCTKIRSTVRFLHDQNGLSKG